VLVNSLETMLHLFVELNWFDLLTDLIRVCTRSQLSVPDAVSFSLCDVHLVWLQHFLGLPIESDSAFSRPNTSQPQPRSPVIPPWWNLLSVKVHLNQLGSARSIMRFFFCFLFCWRKKLGFETRGLTLLWFCWHVRRV
jgi:hypothetical protein